MEDVVVNSCCAEFRARCDKLEVGREALRKGIKLYQQQFETIEKDNLRLKKAYEEEKLLADAERQEKEKEALIRVTLENDIYALKSEILSLQQKGGTGSQDGDREVMLLRTRVSEGEIEINGLKELLEKERKKADSERKRADAEKKKANEARKVAKAEKSRADEERRLMSFEEKKPKETQISSKALKSEADEAKLVSEAFKCEDGNKKVEAEIYRKKAMDEKQRADNLSKQLEVNRGRIEKLQKEIHELISSKKLADESKLDLENLNSEEARRKLETEKQKTVREKKRADSEMKKAEEQRKVAEANRKKAVEQKHRADQLAQQLEDNTRKIELLQKETQELLSSRISVEAPIVPCDKNVCAEIEKLKLLKKQLKFEKMRVKHAKQVAKLEIDRRTILQQELCHLKQELVQFSHRLGVLGNSFSDQSRGIDDLAKTGSVPNLQNLNMKRELLAVEPYKRHSENELLMSNCTNCTAQLLPITGGNCTQSISGIDSKLEPLLRGSTRTMLQTSAINSSTTSFSDGQLVGSQERGAFSEKLNSQPTISSLSGEVTGTRCNENHAVVAENSVRSPKVPHGKKRKRFPDAVEFIEHLYSEGKKWHLRIEEKLSVLHGMLNSHIYRPFEEGQGFDLGGKAYAEKDSSSKKIKASSEERNRENSFSFDEVRDGDYMKLLDLDNADDEKRYRVAIEAPLSPDLPEIEFRSGETCESAHANHLGDKSSHEGFSRESGLAQSGIFGVIDVEICLNKFKLDTTGTTPTCDKNEGCVVSLGNIADNGITTCGVASMDDACVRQRCDPGAELGMLVTSISGNERLKVSHESGLGSPCDDHPRFCVAFSDMKDSDNISRIFRATRTCMVQCSVTFQTEGVVSGILPALLKVEDLSHKERVCVFFSLLLHNFREFSFPSSGNFLNRDSTVLLDSFAAYIRKVVFEVEAGSMFSEICPLDELLTLIEDFLIHRQVARYSDSRVNILPNGEVVIFLFEMASTHQLVAGAIVLASICAAIEHVGFICEASCNIFRLRKFDPSETLTILHVFAYLSGSNYFTLDDYSLSMTVLKSLVVFSEREHFSLPSCSECLFSEGALSVNDVISLLFVKLQNYATSHEEETEQNSDHRQVRCVLCMNCNMSSSSDTSGKLTKQLSYVFDETMCRFSDVLSLVELVGCYMGWEWTCNNIVCRLLKMLESFATECILAPIVVLLGQLGRIGAHTNGLDDIGVVNLRSRLSAFLFKNMSRKAGLCIQIATVTSLLTLISQNFEEIMNRSPELPEVVSQTVPADCIRKWFSLLTNEQQTLSSSLLCSANIQVAELDS